MARYIDADELLKSMQRRYDEICDTYGYHDLYASGYGDAVDAVENAPTAAVEPREVGTLENYKRRKKILDVTCGSRTIWFDKKHPAAIYCDKRRETHLNVWKNDNGKSERTCIIDPDIVCDFTDLPFDDNSFSLVVFDPPHLTNAEDTSWLVKKYSKLDENWPQMIHDGFKEAMRVLKPDGVLVFKWSEHDIPAENVWKAIGQKPLFGHHSGKKMNTFWACFMKIEDEEIESEPPKGD